MNHIHSCPSEVQDMMRREYYYLQDFYQYYQNKLYRSNTEEYGFDFSDMFYYAIKYMERQ